MEHYSYHSLIEKLGHLINYQGLQENLQLGKGAASWGWHLSHQPEDVHRIVGRVWPTTYSLDPCPSW